MSVVVMMQCETYLLCGEYEELMSTSYGAANEHTSIFNYLIIQDFTLIGGSLGL